MSDYVHLPWVGANWDLASPRLMLLGDSHYLTDLSDDSSELTRDIIRGVRDAERRIPFYGKVAELAGGVHATTADGRRDFWNSVAFLNFVPVTVGTVFNAVPTTAMWNAGASQFLRYLEDLKPTHVLSLGQRQWNHIGFPGGWQSKAASEYPDLRYWHTPAGFTIVATWVNHPSSRGFSVAEWTERVNSFLTVYP